MPSGLNLRPFDVETDAEPYRALVNNPEVRRLADRSCKVTPEEHVQWCLEAQEHGGLYAVEYISPNGTADFLGAVWLWNHSKRHKTAEVRIILGPESKLGRGFGSAALGHLAGIAFARLGIEKLYAYVLAINVRARRAFERAGFTLEAVLRDDRIADEKRVDVWRLVLPRTKTSYDASQHVCARCYRPIPRGALFHQAYVHADTSGETVVGFVHEDCRSASDAPRRHPEAAAAFLLALLFGAKGLEADDDEALVWEIVEMLYGAPVDQDTRAAAWTIYNQRTREF